MKKIILLFSLFSLMIFPYACESNRGDDPAAQNQEEQEAMDESIYRNYPDKGAGAGNK
jgi:hypothetical protein